MYNILANMTISDYILIETLQYSNSLSHPMQGSNPQTDQRKFLPTAHILLFLARKTVYSR